MTTETEHPIDPPHRPDPAVRDAAASDPPAAPAPDAHHRPLVVLIGALIVVATLAFAVRAIEPSEPGAFYRPPAPLPTTGAGTIIRSEPLDTAPPGARGWRVLYLSTGMQGEPIAVSGVVLAPTEDAPAGSRKVVAWAHPTTGVASRCAPSIGADGGAGAIPGLRGLLDAGYVVAATDYAGLGTLGPHPYLVGDSEAHAVLDIVRAAGRIDQARAGRSVALWGHSQGGHAALFAGQAAPVYAPELDLVGVAAAAPATELADLLRRDIGSVSGNVLASMALVSWSEVYADRGAELAAAVETPAIPAVELIADTCIETTAQDIIDLPSAEVLQIGFIEGDPWSIPPWNELLAENTPGASPIAAPVLVAQGTADTIVWPGVTATWIATQCGTGVVIDERLYDGRTHTEIAEAAAGDVQAWITDRFAGRPVPTTCSTP